MLLSVISRWQVADFWGFFFAFLIFFFKETAKFVKYYFAETLTAFKGLFFFCKTFLIAHSLLPPVAQTV